MKASQITPHYSDEPIRRLSPIRVLVALMLVVGMFYAATHKVKEWQEEQQVAAGGNDPWYAAYVDVTSKPTYPFEQVTTTGVPQVVLSFIVSSKDDGCIPTWGTYFTMDEAVGRLDLDRRIARLQQQGGKVAISFGGLLNDELALRCTDPDKLLQAYESVIDRYQIDTIDLDLENKGLTDPEATKRRAEVIARLQAKRRADGKSLAVWLTLPVAPQGLTSEGTNAVTEMLKAKVDLAGVNVMTMDYGGARAQNDNMFEASKKALVEKTYQS